MLKTLNMTEQQIKEMSLFNVRKLKINILLMRLKAIFLFHQF